jgi:hypothetical protein
MHVNQASASTTAADATPLEKGAGLLDYFQSSQQSSNFQRILKWFWHLTVKPNWPSI